MRPSHDVAQESVASWPRIAVSVLLAVLFKQLPWDGWALILRPDLVLVAVLFWALHRPSRVGMGLAFVLGILGDFQEGVVFGQHGIAYVFGVYAVQYFRLRFLQFNAAQQATQMLPIFLLVQLLVLVSGWLAGHPPAGINILLPALSGVLAWYLVAFVVEALHGRNALHR
jgi:rod shape-determining protein MreD